MDYAYKENLCKHKYQNKKCDTHVRRSLSLWDIMVMNAM